MRRPVGHVDRRELDVQGAAHLRVEPDRGEAARAHQPDRGVGVVVEEHREPGRAAPCPRRRAAGGRAPSRHASTCASDPPAAPLRVHAAVEEGPDHPRVAGRLVGARVGADHPVGVDPGERVAGVVLPVTVELVVDLLRGGPVRRLVGVLDRRDAAGRAPGRRRASADARSGRPCRWAAGASAGAAARTAMGARSVAVTSSTIPGRRHPVTATGLRVRRRCGCGPARRRRRR